MKFTIVDKETGKISHNTKFEFDVKKYHKFKESDVIKLENEAYMKLAKAMAGPIKAKLQYTSIAAQAFSKVLLPPKKIFTR